LNTLSQKSLDRAFSGNQRRSKLFYTHKTLKVTMLSGKTTGKLGVESRNHPGNFNPAAALKGPRTRRRDFPRIDPFRIQEAEALIAAIHKDWGELAGNFHEFRFFTGPRPSEQIALRVSDFDEAQGTLSVTKSRVYGVDKNITKTREDRVFPLCPRAIAVLRRQLALYRNLRSRGRVDHHQLFFGANGAPIRTFDYLAKCWRQGSTRLGLRFRRPYCARATLRSAGI
jgi:integrase